ncbi:membrane protein [[Pantoea] beijingensis]|uniref:Membrane protein n=1 Tax=[Pantoea] beijingensis TaxID=1324864 RepID=A0A443IG98_9GAMM|nr:MULTISPECIES: YjcB family protein [Erwiniaceae]RWR03088.1 membrane protein [[Pantoea] beijingensis]
MGTLTASVVLMRWELLSAVMMFFASTFKIKCRQHRHNAMAFIFSGIGIGMSCWFVTGLLGITLNLENVNHFFELTKNAFFDVMGQSPATWPVP